MWRSDILNPMVLLPKHISAAASAWLCQRNCCKRFLGIHLAFCERLHLIKIFVFCCKSFWMSEFINFLCSKSFRRHPGYMQEPSEPERALRYVCVHHLMVWACWLQLFCCLSTFQQLQVRDLFNETIVSGSFAVRLAALSLFDGLSLWIELSCNCWRVSLSTRL